MTFLGRACAVGLWLFLSVGQPLAQPANAAASSAQTIAGVVFDGAVRMDGQDLRLNGVGVRAVAWFKGYAAGLYLLQPTANAAQAMAAAGPKRLQMRMLVEVPADEFVKAFHKGVHRNTDPALHPVLAERMEQFDRALLAVGKVQAGDVVNLDFVPARGLQLVLNGSARGPVIPGADLYAALLSVFLGERPVDRELKAGLLGANAR